MFYDGKGCVTPIQFKLSAPSQKINICCLFPRSSVLKGLPKAPQPEKQTHLLEPGVAFCTAELKKASLKKSREPLKTTRALLRACSPAISSVFFPTACGYCGANGHRAEPTGDTPTAVCCGVDRLAVAAPAAVKE